MHKSYTTVMGILVLLFAQPLSAQAALTVSSFERETSLNEMKVVLMYKGDNALFKNNDFDDSEWRVSSLPFSAEDYRYAGSNEDDIFWYRIHVSFPSELPAETVGLSLGKIADVDETYFNGYAIGKSGNFEHPLLHACDKSRMYQIPSKYILAGGENVIAIRVKNSYRADEMPGRGNYYFGNFEQMRSGFFISGFSELFFPIVYLVFFAYFLLLFSKRTNEIENLFYSLFSLGFALYSFCRSGIKYVIIDNFNILQKLEFGSMYFSIAMLMAFILVYYKEKHRLYHYIFYAFSALCIVVLLFLQNHMLWYKLNVGFIQYTWLLPLGTILWVLAKNFKKSLDARIMILSFAFIFSGMLHDIAFSRGLQIFNFIKIWITPFTMFLFVVSLAVILSIRYANFLTQIEVLNETLEQKVRDRTAKLDNTLKEIRIKDEKIEHEMVMAGKVQKALLPGVLPKWDVNVSVRYSPLRQVSGDFYDVLETRDGAYMLLIADVSGHGMPAALHAILAKAAFTKAVLQETSLAAIFRMVNKDMGHIETGHYLTSFMVKFDRDKTLHFANAGHPKGIWLSKKNKKIRLLDTQGTVVGIRDDADSLFQEAKISFESGDRVLLYTDCLTERTNTAGEEFGEKRLVQTLKKYFFNAMETMIDNTMKEYYAFVEGTENKDDLTLVGMEFPETGGRTE